MKNNEFNDLRQQAIAKCLMAGHQIDPSNPNANPYYRSAFRSAQVDFIRRHQSQDRRIEESKYYSIARERYCSDSRYLANSLDTEDPAKLAEISEQLCELQKRVSFLPEDERFIITEHYTYQQPFKIIAAKLGRTTSAVRSHHGRIIAKLSEELPGNN